MTDQEKREKVIKGLECRLDINGSKYKHCLACDYRHDIDHCQWACQTDGILEDALALLKAQEPRVMTYDELATFDGAFLIESSTISQLVWVFFFDMNAKSDAIRMENFDGERYIIYREKYGTYARCWTSRPTDEQREATPWLD